MKYFTFYEIVISCVFTLALGGVFGVIHVLFKELFFYVESILSLPKTVYNISKNEKPLELNKHIIEKDDNIKQINEIIKDFLFFSILGLGYLLISYAFCDGILRLYILVIYLMGFYLSDKFTGVFTNRIFELLYKVIYGLLSYSFVIILLAIRFVFNKIIAKYMLKLNDFICKKLNLPIKNSEIKRIEKPNMVENIEKSR